MDIKAHPAVLGIYAARLPGIQKRNGEYWAKCIFHPDKNPSLSITRKNNEFLFHCFGCGLGGDVIQFLELSDKISFTEAKKLVEKVTGGNWDEAKKLADATFHKLEIEDSVPKKRYTLEEYAKFEIALYESKEAQDWLFTERGITYDTARKLHFGYFKDLDTFSKLPAGKTRDPNLERIAKQGWIVTPAVEGEEVVCIEARSMAEKNFVRKSGMDYKVLTGVDFISVEEPIYVVEGRFDQAIMVQAGYRAVSLPNAGAKLTPDQRDLLMTASMVILAGDNDGGVGTDAMIKLHAELQERTFRLVWPREAKDANGTFLGACGRDLEAFRKVVDHLTLKGISNPLPGIKSIQDILKNDQSESAESRTDRFQFSMKPMDKMANVFPGSVVYITAASTGSGKTQITLQETLRAAMKNNAVVLNYQTQLQGEEIGEIVTANLLAKDRNSINREDRLEAAKRLRGVQYYVGHNPSAGSSEEVLNLIEAGVRRVGANVIVIDLVHDICNMDKDEIKSQQRAMRRLKLMAQRFLAVVFVIGQPRKVDSKNVGKPMDIYDSKGSEAVVSESDVVFFMYREPIKNMTEETLDRLSPEVQIRCMKARSKGKGSAFAKVFFLGKIATFREIVPIEDPPKIDNRFDF